jgi:ABC-type sulfate/molybdate transport systems ATPase subunit
VSKPTESLLFVVAFDELSPKAHGQSYARNRLRPSIEKVSEGNEKITPLFVVHDLEQLFELVDAAVDISYD